MRKKINLLSFWCGFLILGFTSCQKDSNPDTNFVFDIEDEFELSLTEKLVPGDNTSFWLNISSLREFECTNYGLESSKNVFVNNSIQVAVSELIVPDDCIEGNAPAIGQVSFDALEPGTYEFSISIVNQIENKGTLYVQPDFYEMQIEDGNGILMPQTILQKIPNQTIWGYVSYEDNNIDLVGDLLADLNQSLESLTLPDGNYGHFQYNDGQVTIPNVKASYSKHRSFVFHLNISVDDLMEIVEETYCPLYNDKIDLMIFTSDGHEIECI